MLAYLLMETEQKVEFKKKFKFPADLVKLA